MRNFLKDSTGNAAIMFAAAALPLLLSAGVAIDMVRANRTQTILQGAADAAALAGGVSAGLTEAQVKEVVKKYAMANGVPNALDHIQEIKHKLDKKSRTFSVTIRGKLDTSLMQLANISEMEIEAYSEVVLGSSALEVALVLDTTGSMGAPGRMDALKPAANGMIADLMEMKASGADVKVSVVPFGEYVNVGVGNRSESWLSVPPDSTTTQNVCTTTYPNASSSNCRMETQTYLMDGVPTTGQVQVCDWVYGDPVTSCADQTYTNTWLGCVGSRNNPLDEVLSGNTPYPGLQNVSCGRQVEPLTSDEAVLKDAIDGLFPSGNTYIPAGLIWGWNMLDPADPFEGAKSFSQMESLGGTKAIVLMTDGANTLSADYPYHWGTVPATADAKTLEICKNIKKDKIVVFTISFMVDSPSAEAIMKQCATDPSKAYNADSAAELTKAFKDIGAMLQAIRLSK